MWRSKQNEFSLNPLTPRELSRGCASVWVLGKLLCLHFAWSLKAHLLFISYQWWGMNIKKEKKHLSKGICVDNLLMKKH
jgi:hypothetical protein